ncbi:MAG: insulinase family protein [Kaiparowitsia implicata GSE-PSE-MK54-09C]|jgi:predicted Zn-dependent peptidase|nr:insulinase family protein [Kaiparowitsia implicata GSE-PSE-MK54-09C]
MTFTLAPSAQFNSLNSPTIQYLPNGITLIAEQVPVNAVNLSLWLRVGSSAESDAINGMAHYLEHMVFKGTNRLESGEFERLIEQRGAVTNAATSQDYTHYYITTAPQDFADLAPHQLEVVLNAAIPDEAFERERSVILEEIRRSQDSPQRRLYRTAMQTGFDRMPYRRPVLGPSEVIEHLTAQQMRDFHQQWYQPSRMTAVAVGNLPVEQLMETLIDGFESIASHASAPVHKSSINPAPVDLSSSVPEPPFTSIVRQTVVDPTLQQARLVMLWRVPGMQHLPQTYVFDMLAAVLGQGRMARLVRDLREDRRLVSSVGVSNMTYHQQGLFYISAQLSVEHLETVEAAIVQHIQRLHDEPVAESELQRICTLVTNRFVFGNEAPSDRASLYGYYQATVSDLEPALNYPAKLRSLDPEELQAAAQRSLSPQAYGVVVMRPED